MRALIAVTLCVLSLVVWAQEKISLHLEQVPTTEAIASFSKTSGYHFVYNPDILRQELHTVSIEDMTLQKAVNHLFASSYNFKIRGSYIILLPKQLTELPKTKHQDITIRGEVKEKGTNKKLEDVSIYEIHSLKPVLTNQAGDYALSVTRPQDIAFIAISKENYEDTVIQVKKNSFWSISLRKKNDSSDKRSTEGLFDRFSGDKVQTHSKNINLTERRWIHLALTPGVSTNGFLSGQLTNKFSTNVIAGYSYALEGVEFGGALNMERSYVQGLQLSGGLNINGDYLQGMQLAGATNITLGKVTGAQIGGFSNHGQTLAGGVQIAGAVNTSTEGRGSQWAAGANWNAGTFQGVQVSSGLNFTRKLRGAQIGIVNVADTVEKGFMLGIINWTKDGLHHFELSSNDVTPYNVAFKSGVYPFYTILKVGINPHQAQLWDYGSGFGSYHAIRDRAFLDFEATQHVIQALDKSHMKGLNTEIRFTTRFGYQLASHLQLIAGPQIHYLLFKPSNPEDLTFADRFGQNPWQEWSQDDRVSKLWLGYEVALRF